MSLGDYNSSISAFRNTVGDHHQHLVFRVPHKAQWSLTCERKTRSGIVKKWVPLNEGNLNYKRYIECTATRIFGYSQELHSQAVLATQRAYAQKIEKIGHRYIEKGLEGGKEYRFKVIRNDKIEYICLLLKNLPPDYFSLEFGFRYKPSPAQSQSIATIFNNATIRTLSTSL